MAANDHVIAGSRLSKVAGSIAKILPDTVNARIHRLVSERGEANQ